MTDNQLAVLLQQIETRLTREIDAVAEGLSEPVVVQEDSVGPYTSISYPLLNDLIAMRDDLRGAISQLERGTA